MSDLIDRQAALAIIQNMYPGIPRVPWMRKDWQKQYAPYIQTENAIRELPSAEKTGKWIPVTERKPEVEQLVWLYTKDNSAPYNVFVGYLSEDYWWVECGVNYSEYSPSCIVAWQPLNKPEPYNCGARMVIDNE